MSAITLDRTVGQLVAEQPARSRVFEKLGIDYCCGGRKPLAEAVAAHQLDAAAVLRDLAASDNAAPAPETNWTAAPLAALVDHIMETHHDYLREALPRLSFLTEKVSNAHGEKNPRLIELRDVFAAFRRDMEAHTQKEELILFPLCREIGTATGPVSCHCGSVANPIRVMMAEHDDAGGALQRMRSLTDGYVAPETACNTYRAMLQALEELESNTHQHVHKENNILFPRAEAAEAALSTAV